MRLRAVNYVYFRRYSYFVIGALGSSCASISKYVNGHLEKTRSLQSSGGHLMPKVIGGTQSPWTAYPFMASLAIEMPPTSIGLCGGSIISSTWILTAAHCIVHVNERQVLISIGSPQFARGIRHAAAKLIVHPQYDGENNDIALIRLARPVMNGQGKRVTLGHEKELAVGTEATLIGWGVTSVKDDVHKLPLLHSVKLHLAKCQRPSLIEDFRHRLDWIAKRDNDDDFSGKNIICTSTRNHHGACVGDSGGPLLVNGKQVGVVSRGMPCALGAPDVYTLVQAYIPWIQQQTKIKFK